jgi:hypothetical protein
MFQQLGVTLSMAANGDEQAVAMLKSFDELGGLDLD